MTDIDNTTTTGPDRREMLKGAVLGAAAVGTLVALTACDGDNPADGAQQTGQKQTETVFAKMQTAVPYPSAQLTDSIERRNLAERLLRYNQPSKIGYLYLLASTGAIITYFTIKGKVSSTQSQMTTSQLIQWDQGSGGGGNMVVDAPGDDGSYGPNEPGIFAFTTENVMVNWSGDWLLTDAPLKINPAALTLTYIDGSKPSNSAGQLAR